MNPYGEVSLENYGDVVTVNGHSYAAAKTDRTNFALLVSTDFTEPFDDPIAYGKSIARLANLLGEDIIVQRLGDLQQGHRSTMDRIRRGTVQPTLKGATAGDLAFVLPYRHLRDILDMLEAMDNLAPGVNGRDTLLYGVEVKFYSARPELDAGLQTPVQNLYAVGDGAGITRGLVQASAAGVIAARSILNGRALDVARVAVPVVSAPSGATKAKARSPTCWPRRPTWSRASRAATTPATRSSATARSSSSTSSRRASSTRPRPASSATAWSSTRTSSSASSRRCARAASAATTCASAATPT